MRFTTGAVAFISSLSFLMGAASATIMYLVR